ncbi:MFS transporter [Bacillus sp. CGMCC 1.16607]|uniref:MFS transporter n=1 Tax=Bacillus sp. CGMCC 1.16607 TaxID=3351842 RepID=UPI00364154FE
MNRLLNVFRTYHPIVIILIIGTALIFTGLAMSTPFLAIYLAEKTNLNATSIGLLIGLGALSGTFGGFLGGTFSDLLGRKSLIIGSLLTSSLVYFGYAFANQIFLLSTCIIAGGFAASIFRTVSNAFITDLTEKEQQIKVFSFLNMAVNIGWGVGPLIGVYFGLTSTNIPFILTGIIYVFYTFTIFVLLSIYHVQPKVQENRPSRITFTQSLKMLKSDKVLFWFVLGGLVLAISWGQFSILLSQFLVSEFDNGTKLFGILLSVNAVSVIVMQLPMTRWLEKKQPQQILTVGVLFILGGLLGFSISYHIITLIIAIILLSIAETVIMPLSNVLIDEIAPKGMSGTYFGAQNFSSLGIFMSPILGGFLLDVFNGRIMYIVLAAIAIASIGVYHIGFRLHQSKQQKVLSERQSAAY